MNIKHLNKTQLIFLAVIFVFIAVSVVLHYSGYFLQFQGGDKTTEELKQEAKTLMLAGELDSFAGKITKIEDETLFVKVITPNHPKTGEEIKVKITKNTLIRKIEFPEIPEGATELVPAIEVIIELIDLKIGNSVFIDSNKSGEAVVIDLIRAETQTIFDEPIINEDVEDTLDNTDQQSLSMDVRMFVGVIVEINSNDIVVEIKTQDHPQFGKNINVLVTGETTLHKIIFPDGNDGSFRGDEIDISFGDLKIGDNIFLAVDENNNAISIDQ